MAGKGMRDRLAGMAKNHWFWIAFLCLLLPTLALFWQIVFAGKVLFWGVPLMQFVPWYQSAVDAVRGGELPLWNPLVGNGAPLLANYQSALFYPPNWLIFIIPPARAMSWLMVLHVIWAGLGAWMFARSIGLRPFSRLVSALSFMFSGYLVSRLGFASIGSALPWLPWLFWGGERLLRRPSLNRALLLGIALGMQWLAGHAQTSFYSGLALGLYLFWRCLAAERDARPGFWRSSRSPVRMMGLFLLAVLLGAGISLVQLLPTAELQQLSHRSGGVEAGFGLTYSLWPLRLIAFLSPRFFGHPATGNYWGYCCNYWEDNGYTGLLPLLLALGIAAVWVKQALQAVVSRWKKREDSSGGPLDREPAGRDAALLRSLIPFFSLLALLSLLLSFGVHTPIYPWVFEHVPGFGQFQAPVRLLCLWTLCISVLAGIGAELWRPTGRLKTAGRYGTAAGLAFILAAVVVSRFLAGNPRTFIAGIAQLGAGLVVIGLLILKQPRPDDGNKPDLWSILVLLFIIVDLTSAVWGANPAAEPWLYTRRTESSMALTEAGVTGRTFYPSDDEYRVTYTCAGKDESCRRYLSFKQFGPPDTAYWFGLRETLLPDLGLLDGVPSSNNFDPLLPGRYVLLIDAINQSKGEDRDRLLDLMGVEILVTDQPQSKGELVYANQDVFFTRLPGALDRAYVVFEALVVDDPNEALEALASPHFDPRKTVILENAGQPVEEMVLTADNTGEPASLEWLADRNNSVRIRVTLPAGGYLVLLDSYYPGWQVRVDGEPGEILPANLNFRAVPLAAGKHLVEFVYRPDSLRIGDIITCATWLVIGCLFVSRVMAKRHNGREHDHA